MDEEAKGTPEEALELILGLAVCSSRMMFHEPTKRSISEGRFESSVQFTWTPRRGGRRTHIGIAGPYEMTAELHFWQVQAISPM